MINNLSMPLNLAQKVNCTYLRAGVGVLGLKLKSKVLITGRDAKVTSQQIHVHVTLADVKRTKTDEKTLPI